MLSGVPSSGSLPVTAFAAAVTLLLLLSSLGVNGAPAEKLAASESIALGLKTMYSLTFSETGLPSGHEWNVTLHKVGKMSTTTNAIVFAVPNGAYTYQISVAHPQMGYKTSFSGTVVVNGTSITLHIIFTRAQYDVTFEERGLRRNAPWMVVVGSKSKSGAGTTLSMKLANGTFSFTANSTNYADSSGTFAVSGGPVNVTVVLGFDLPRGTPGDTDGAGTLVKAVAPTPPSSHPSAQSSPSLAMRPCALRL